MQDHEVNSLRDFPAFQPKRNPEVVYDMPEVDVGAAVFNKTMMQRF
jgi:hypothetical protein